MKLTIKGTVPSLKNSKKIYRTRSGKPFITSSDRSKEWMNDKYFEVLSMNIPKMIINEDNPVCISMKFYNSTKRKSDIDNKITTVLDLLKNTNVIPDDNCFIVRSIHGEFCGVDKHDARVEIAIDYMER